MGEIGLLLAAEILYIYVMNMFFRNYFRVRYKTLGLVITWSIYFVISTGIDHLTKAHLVRMSPMITMLVAFFVLLGVTSIICMGSIKQKLLVTLFMIFLGMVSEILAMFFLVILKQTNAQDILNNDAYYYLGSLYSKIIFLLLIKVVVMVSKERNDIDVKAMDWISIILIPLGSIFVIHKIAVIGFVGELKVDDFITIFIILLINVFVFYLYDKVKREARLETEKVLLEKQVNFYESQYYETQSHYEVVRSYQHDLKNHYNVLKHYIDYKKYDELEQYCKGLLDQIGESYQMVNTGNIAVDAILNCKIHYAETIGVKIIPSIDIPEMLDINPVDICIIIGNITDNAIEAVRYLEDVKKTVLLNITYDLPNLMIHITNPFEGKIKKTWDNSIISKKKDKNNHGIGIKNIKKVVEKYNGLVDIGDSNDIFEMNILLNNINCK